MSDKLLTLVFHQEYLDFLISQIVKEHPEGELQDRIKKPVTNNSRESLVTGFFCRTTTDKQTCGALLGQALKSLRR